ncbi:PTS sugar transporter subunit IIB [Neisseria meningitidis]|nr:PTS sugar transporter subunit IIB [Neisseria meningitidis]
MGQGKNVVACGEGMATSTGVTDRVERWVKENNVDAEVKQIKISEAASMQDGADLIVSTTILPTTYKIPAIIATSYITGMGMEELDEEILAHLK